MKKKNKLLSVVVTVAIILCSAMSVIYAARNDSKIEIVRTFSAEDSKTIEKLYEITPYYIVVRHYQLGGSHYAYTEGLAEDNAEKDTAPEFREGYFYPGSEMALLTLQKNSDGTYSTVEEVLLSSPEGVIRDPDVSADGQRVLFSWKKTSSDDYHLYEMNIGTREITELTFGSGISDTEGKYLSDGSVVFNSSRATQMVDCWITQVSNLFKCNSDGSEIIRLGRDQVHTTYPTVTSDGRVIYTRWDYNDRTQMWVQGVFQMFEDGTNQTELWGNNATYPPSLLHTREIPGEVGKYISIATGHHVKQSGKLVIVDTNISRNSKESVSFVFDDGTRPKAVDSFGMEGKQYKYPYAMSGNLFIYSTVDKYSWVNAPYRIAVYDRESEREITLAETSNNYPASQCVPVFARNMFSRPSMVNYASETGTFYVSNVYEGQSMEGVQEGAVKYLRVVELEYRSSSIGATVARGEGSADQYSPISTGNGSWDVKKVIGVVPVEEDGSALFKAPANAPLYFQLLDENGCVIQTMRSWATLMPNETFSCVGCHVDKNTAPTVNGKVTLAMKKGVSEIIPDLFMTDENYDPYSDADGFSYLKEIQPILDKSCVVCHSNRDTAHEFIGDSADEVDVMYSNSVILPRDAEWNITDSNGKTSVARAPFSDGKTAPGEQNSVVSGKFTAKASFIGTYFDLNSQPMFFIGRIAGRADIYVNGKLVFSFNNTSSKSVCTPISNEMRKAFRFGENEIKIEAETKYFDIGIFSGEELGEKKIFADATGEWEYLLADNLEAAPDGWTTKTDDAEGWTTAATPFGNFGLSGGKTIFLRKTFKINDAAKYEDSPLRFEIINDDNVDVFINGTKCISSYRLDIEPYYMGYVLTKDATEYLKNGENVIAVSLNNTRDIKRLDFSLYAHEKLPESEAVVPLDPSVGKGEISLESQNIMGYRTKKNWPLSYLVLTSTKVISHEIIGNTSGKYINYLSSMSKAETIKPYSFGSGKSDLVKRLRSGHGGLSEEEIRKIECFIDLCAPCYGDYNENVVWNDNAVREYEEKNNKRTCYDGMNKAIVDAKGGKYSENDKLSIEFTGADGAKTISASGIGYAILNISETYKSGQKIKITLPEGEKYVAVCLSSRLGESIVYCENGIFEYTFPANMANIFPLTLNENSGIVYVNNVAFARIPTNDELLEKRNLALNPYDLTNAANVFPHAFTNSVADDNAEHYAARCAIDGFSANTSHGVYPVQSWGPDKDSMSENYITVDFGREIVLDSLEIVARCDFPHDTWFTDADVTLSDGSVTHIDLYKTKDAMTFDMGGVKTSSIKLSGFKTAVNNWAAISEIRAIGHDSLN